MVSISLTLIQLGMIGLLILILFGAVMFFGMFWWDIKTKFNDVYVRQYCTKKHLPIIRTINGAGREAWLIGDKDKDYDLKFKGKERNVLVDPAYLSKMPSNHLSDGTPLYDFHTNFHFPIDKVGVSGVVSMFRKIRDEYAQLIPIRDDFVILELMGKNGSDLESDCKKVLGRFDVDEDECSPKDLTEVIESIKSNLKDWKIEPGYMSVNQAVSRLPFGTFAVDIAQIEEVTEQNYENDWGQRNSMIMTYGMAGLLICVGGGIAVYIISMATKGGI
jgi:hypothetical protein